MTDKNENESIPPESFIQIIFNAPGSAIFGVQTNQVTPLQFIAAAKYLEMMGEDGIRQQAAQIQQNKIVVPNPVLQ